MDAAYAGVSEKEINAMRMTSRGKAFTLKHPNELTVSMRFKGENASGANSQGWERNCGVFFRQLSEKHPEYFSEKNLMRIRDGRCPRVNRRFVSHFPQYETYKGQTIIHHHIGRDGRAVAIPRGMHNGRGEIHNVEDQLGITRKAKDFSGKCQQYCQKHPDALGKTSREFEAILGKGQSSAQTPEPRTALQKAIKAKGDPLRQSAPRQINEKGSNGIKDIISRAKAAPSKAPHGVDSKQGMLAGVSDKKNNAMVSASRMAGKDSSPASSSSRTAGSNAVRASSAGGTGKGNAAKKSSENDRGRK